MLVLAVAAALAGEPQAISLDQADELPVLMRDCQHLPRAPAVLCARTRPPVARRHRLGSWRAGSARWSGCSSSPSTTGPARARRGLRPSSRSSPEASGTESAQSGVLDRCQGRFRIDRRARKRSVSLCPRSTKSRRGAETARSAPVLAASGSWLALSADLQLASWEASTRGVSPGFHPFREPSDSVDAAPFVPDQN